MQRSDFLTYSAEKNCSQCRKRTFVPDTTKWVFKIPRRGGGHEWFCGWTCMCAWRKKHEKPPKEASLPPPPRYQVGKHPNNVKEIRAYFGITRKAVMEYIQCSPSTYTAIEMGSRIIQQKWLTRLCRAFGCRPADITQKPFDETVAEMWECRIKENSGLSEE